MDVETLRQLIEGVSSGSIAPDDAVERLKRLPFSDVGDTLVDHHRHLRQGAPEAVYGPGKSSEQCVLIVRELLDHGGLQRDGLKFFAQLCRVNGDGAKGLRGVGVVGGVGPGGVLKDVMVVLDKELQQVDEPGVVVTDLREAVAPPLRHVVVVAVAPLGEEALGHLGPRDPGAEGRDEALVMRLSVI
mgnify:CR=1 FL=1